MVFLEIQRWYFKYSEVVFLEIQRLYFWRFRGGIFGDSEVVF